MAGSITGGSPPSMSTIASAVKNMFGGAGSSPATNNTGALLATDSSVNVKPTQSTQAVNNVNPVNRQSIAQQYMNRLIGTVAQNMRSAHGPQGKCYLDNVGVPSVMDAISKIVGLKAGAASKGGNGLGAALPYIISPWEAANTFAKDSRFQEVTADYKGKAPPDGSITFFQRTAEAGHPGHIEINKKQPNGTTVAYSDGAWPINPADPERTHRYSARRVFILKPEAAEKMMKVALDKPNDNLKPNLVAILNNARKALDSSETQNVASNSTQQAQPAGKPVPKTTGSEIVASTNRDAILKQLLLDGKKSLGGGTTVAAKPANTNDGLNIQVDKQIIPIKRKDSDNVAIDQLP